MVVTATTNDHSGGAHARRRAVDFTLSGGVLDADTAVCCSLGCGARYVQDEYHHSSPNATGGHIHAQMDRGANGASGTGKYRKPKCKPCSGPSFGDLL